MKTRRALVLVVVMALAFATGALAQASDGVLWFSQRVLVLSGHPVRFAQNADLVPGPLVVWFITDDSNRKTCVMVMRDLSTGQTYPLGPADAGSCNLQ